MERGHDNLLKRIECKPKSKTTAAKINLERANFVNPWMRGTVLKYPKIKLSVVTNPTSFK